MKNFLANDPLEIKITILYVLTLKHKPVKCKLVIPGYYNIPNKINNISYLSYSITFFFALLTYSFEIFAI